MTGKTLRVALKLRDRTRVQLAVVKRRRVVAATKARTLAKGRHRLSARLNRTPSGSGLKLRVTAQNLKTRKRGRGLKRLTIVAVPTPSPTPTPTPTPTAVPTTTPTPTPTPTPAPGNPPTDIALSNTTVDEAQAGATVGGLSATDADALDTHSYTLVPGAGDADNGSFAIDGSLLKTADALDFETQVDHTVRVRVSDGTGATFEKSFAIAVNDVNEPPTRLNLTGTSVAENATSGTAVGTLSAHDQDAGQTLTYSLVSGVGDTDNARFTVDGTTLRTAGVFDFETKSSYAVRLGVSDGDGGTSSAPFTVTVIDVNEAPHSLTLSDASIEEQLPAGTVVGTFSAIDPDAGQTLTYSLVAGSGDTDNASFTIDDGALKSAATFDSDTKSSYAIRAAVSDGHGGATEKAFTVTVTPSCTINGTTGPETITGTEGDDYICGNGGGDIIKGLGGADTIRGGSGVDTIDGGEGADLIYAYDDSDEIIAGPGVDLVFGGAGHDNIAGGADNDTLFGETGDDSLAGETGSDKLDGGEANDLLDPGAGDDSQIDGGSGHDGIAYAPATGALTIDLDAGTSTGGGGNDQFTGIESAHGGDSDDTLLGEEGTNDLSGRGGNDTVDGRGGDDDILGGVGDDSLRGGAGIDTVDGQADTDVCGDAGDTLLNCELSFNSPPVLTIGDPTNAFTEGMFAQAVDSTLTVTDDSTALTGASISIASGFESGKDILSVGGSLPAGVTASYVAPTLTISGSASPAQYQAVLRSVKFENTSQNPSTTTRSIVFSVSDSEYADSGNEVLMSVHAVNDAPVADADSYGGGQRGIRMRVGTTHADTHEVEVAGRVLDGDSDVDTPAGNLTVTPGTITTADGGTVTMASDGSFTYDPAAGDDGSDSFTYTVEDNDTGDSDGTEGTHTATVTITQAGPRVWFVDDTAPAGGRGVSHAPLQSLAPLATGGAHETRDGSGDHIFVYAGSYPAGIDLEANQKLIGEPNGLNVGGTQFVAAGGTRPAISSPSTHAVALHSGNEVQDVALGGTPAGFYSLHAPAGAGAFTVAGSDINNPSGGGMQLEDGTPTVSLGTLSSNGSSASALRIVNTDGGSVSSTGGTLQNAAGADVHLANANSALTLGSNVSDDIGQLISISGGTGAATFNGTVTDGVDGDGNGISISSAGGAVNFANAVTLSTGSNNALTATNSSGGLRMVPASGANTLATTDGAALTVTNTPIHPNGLSFRSITATDPAKNAGTYGIHLDSTGTTGANGTLTVTGNGAAGTGGTITGKSTGIRLVSTRSPSFSWMKLHDHGDFAIYGSSLQSFQMDRTVIDGQGGTQNGDDPNVNEGAVSFDNLHGTGASITNSTIAQGVANDLRVVNTSGTLNRLTVDTTTFSNTLGTHNDGIMLEALNSSVLNATIRNSTFQGARGDHIDLNASQSSASDLIVQGNTLTNSHPSSLGGSINADSSGTADLTYLVDNNTINGAKGTAIFVGKQFGGAPGDGTAIGTITNNRVGTAGVASSGSLNGSGIEASTLARGKHSTVISNNQVRQYRDNGISLFVGGSPTSTTGLPAHDAVVNLTVTGNFVSNPGPNGALAGAGLFLNSGTNSPDAYQVCLNMQNNQLSGSQPLGAGSRDVWLRQRFNTVVRMPGYTGAEHNGAGTLTTDVTNYLTGRSNTLSTIGVSTQDTVNGGGGFFNTGGGAACPTT